MPMAAESLKGEYAKERVWMNMNTAIPKMRAHA